MNTTMTDEQINAKIAEACGWKLLANNRWTRPDGFYGDVPNYCNDLNHIRSLLIKSSEEHLLDQMLYLLDVINRHPDRSKWAVCADLICASPRQHAEAFLRTMNLWEE